MACRREKIELMIYRLTQHELEASRSSPALCLISPSFILQNPTLSLQVSPTFSSSQITQLPSTSHPRPRPQPLQLHEGPQPRSLRREACLHRHQEVTLPLTFLIRLTIKTPRNQLCFGSNRNLPVFYWVVMQSNGNPQRLPLHEGGEHDVKDLLDLP